MESNWKPVDPEELLDKWRLHLAPDEELDTLPSNVSYRAQDIVAPDAHVLPNPDFEPTDRIGGGMGEVYRAHQRTLGREVALKKLKRDTSTARHRFVAEGVVTGQLEHPNIVPIYSMGKTGSGELFMAMRLVGGQTWEELLAGEARHDLLAQLEILIQVCNGLAYAHSKHIVHNDLKPENIMVGRFGEVLILDWGLAVDVGEQASSLPHVRHRSSVRHPCGTPVYMAPEQAAGRGYEISPRTDVFLMGGILYKLLTGRPPNQGGGLLAILAASLRTEPLQFGDDVPAELRAICERALSAHPQERHGSIEAFQLEIRNYLRHRESLALTRASLLRLDSLRVCALSEDGQSSFATLFSECRFGFQQALRVWPENLRAQEGLQEALVCAVEYELKRGALTAAEALYSQLPEERPALRERLDAARREAEADRSEVLRMRQEEDRRLGRQTRLRTIVALTASMSALTLLAAVGWFAYTWRNFLLVSLGYVLCVAVGLYLGRRGFSSNRFNKRVAYSFLFLSLESLAFRISALLLGLPLQGTIALETGMYVATFLLLSLVLDPRFAMYGLCFVPAAVAALLWPAHAFYFWSAASGLAGLLLIVQWKLRFRLARRAGGKPTAATAEAGS